MLQFVFDDLQHLLISMARSFKYFHDVLYPSDKFQTLLIFNMFTCSYSIPYMWPTRSWGLNLNMWTCWRSKVFEICHILLLLFCLNKDQFWFLLMLKTSSAEVRQKKLYREIQIAQPPIQLQGCLRLQMKDICGKTLLKIFMYCVCKSGRKLR